MRGSAAFRASVAPGGVLVGPWVRDELWRRARAVPSLDLRFADNNSLVDATTGQSLVTFTRASSGTFVGSNGVLQTAVTNLVLRSEEFDNASWTVNPGSKTVTANTTAAPNGTLTADTVTANGISAAHFVDQTVTLTAISYVFTVYAKAGTNNFIQLRASATLGNRYANFDVSTGATGTSGNITSSSIEFVGNGWYRCSMVFTSTAATGTLGIILVTSNSAGSGETNSLSTSVILWGAQLEQSNTVGEYIPTTSAINSAPRFDHNPTTGESLGLLVEEQRTNLFQFSEAFDNAYWAKGNLEGTLTANQAVAPDGATTADLYQEDTATIGRYIGRIQSFTSGTTYSFSCWAKQAPGATRYLGLLLPSGAFGANAATSFTLSGAGSFTISTSGTNTSAQIQAFPNGWYRCTLISQATVTTSSSVQIRLSSSASIVANPYTGDGTSGIYIWGAQLEAAAFPTSYIPTTSATVTRSTDVASITETNFSSWYRQDEGTMFASARTNATYGGVNSFPRIYSIHDGSTGNIIENSLRVLSSATSQQFSVDVSGTTQATFAGASETNGSPTGLAYATDNFAFSIAGQLVNTDASGSLPSVSQMRIGGRPSSNLFNGTIRRLTYWPVRLGNTVLQQITQ